MICPTCHHDNPPATRFCAACQAFLAWDPAPGPDPAPQPPDPESRRPGPVPQPPGPPQGHGPAQPPGPAPQPGPEPRPQPSPRGYGPPPAQPSAAARGFGPAPRPYEPVPPPMPQSPPPVAPRSSAEGPVSAGTLAGQPAAVPLPPPDPRSGPLVPDAAAARRPGERTERPQPVTGFFDVGAEQDAATPARLPDRPCPRCQAANPAERHLCARCGAVLDPRAPDPAAPAPVPEAPLPWWRRLRRRRERAVAAGYRPRARTGTRRRLRPRAVWPAVAVVLALGGWLARGQLSNLVSDIRDRSSKPAPLHPNSATASSADPAHPAGMAFDGYANRYWTPAAPGAGVGQYVEAGFPQPVHLVTIIVTPGCSADDGTFLTQARPSKITLTFYDAAGHATARTVSLHDQAGPQTFDVHASDVVRIRLTTDASYGATGGHRLAVAEVEFFGRQ
ncbi:NADase-type glycan-binding domain-containing protein [Streptomyces sp. NPDC020983]|uniref:NADase-type glycan-binding domain-containing protein n=1 Tax=Streptomyces sp. NPDC020983 TaxID=3365106 RepID=UPI003787E55C